ncbi:MAG: hypothetical protein ACU0A4_17190 [Paracoccaceae bacterium]
MHELNPDFVTFGEIETRTTSSQSFYAGMLTCTGTQPISEWSYAKFTSQRYVSRHGLQLSNFIPVRESDATMNASGHPDYQPTLRHDLARQFTCLSYFQIGLKPKEYLSETSPPYFTAQLAS